MGDRLYRKKDATGRPAGPWYASYYGPHGRRSQFCTWCLDRAAARDALRQKEREAHAPGGPAAHAPPHSVEQALQYLITHGCSDLSQPTIRCYAQKAGHVLRLLGGRDVNQLTLDDTQTYINTRLDEGAHRETVRKELCVIRLALGAAKERRLLREDPRALFPKFRVRYTPRERYLEPAEFTALLAQLLPERQKWVMVAVYTGGRASEVEALQVGEHVNLATRRLFIPGTKTTKSARKFPLPAPLAEYLAAHPSVPGPVVRPWPNVRRDLASACKRAGIPRASPNDLRRTFASWMKQAGVDSMTVAKLLGHTTSRMVELVYGQLNDAAYTKAIDTLPPLQPPPPATGVAAPRPVRPRRGPTHTKRQPSPSPRSLKPRLVLLPAAGAEPATRESSPRQALVRPQLRLVSPRKPRDE